MHSHHLFLLLIIGVLLFLGGIVLTAALFTDVETNSANLFSAGTLTLSVSGDNNTAFDAFQVVNVGTTNQILGGKTWTIQNTGSVPGQLFFSVTNLLNTENGCNEAERAFDTSCANPGVGQGELGGQLATKVFIDSNLNDAIRPSLPVIDTTFAATNQSEFASQWQANGGTIILQPGTRVAVTMTWSTDPTHFNNILQGDSVQFGMKFDLQQVQH